MGILVFFGAYNEYGEVTRTDGASVPTTYFDYDVSGNQVASWRFEGEGAGEVQILDLTFYDEAGQATGAARAVLPAGAFVETDLATAQIDAEYVLWSNSTIYNAAGQVETTTDRFGLVSENTYDARGQLVQTRSQSTDEIGGTVWLLTRTAYDAAGRATHSTNQYVEGATEPIGGTVTTYDAAGRVLRTDQIENLQIGLVGPSALLSSIVADIGATVSSSTTLYDTAGRTTTSTDSFGNESRTTYSVHGNVIQTATQTIDENGDAVWLLSRTIYDDHGRAVLSTDTFVGDDTSPDDVAGVPTPATRTVYDSLGRVSQTVRLEGAIVDVGQVAGHPETILTSGGSQLYTTETIYNAQGQVARSIAADGQTTDYEYDPLGRRVATIGHAVPAASVGITPPAGATHVSLRSETIYNTDDDSDGRIESERTNIYQFDNGIIDDTAAQETSYQYDEHGNRTRTTFNDGSYILIRYDTFGRQTAETQQTAAAVTAEWSDTENSFVIAGTTNPIPTKLYEYDGQGRLSAVELPAVPDPDDNDIPKRPRYEYGYDAQGNQTLIRDPLSRETRFTFDGEGRQLSRTLPLGFGPDGIQGTADDATLPEGDFTEHFEYDTRGRQQLHISFEGVVTEFLYDATNGRLAEKRFFADLVAYDNGNGTPAEITAYTYDAFGHNVEVIQDRDGNLGTTPDQRLTNNTFDAFSQLISVATAEGTIHYEYDALGRMTRTYTGMEDTIGMAAASDGIAITDTHYAYDTLGRLDAVTVVERFDTPLNTPEVTDYFYDLLGNLDETHSPNGIISDYQFDDLNRLTMLRQFRDEDSDGAYTAAVDALLAEYDYDLRADGKRSGVTETDQEDNETRIDWTYDELGRLVRESYNSYDDSLDFVADYIFDLFGNRVEKHTDTDPTFSGEPTFDESTAYDYDANDRLLTETRDVDGTADDRFTVYDYHRTQQTGKTVYEGLDDTGDVVEDTSYVYNLQGRMAEVTIDADGDGLADTRIEHEYNDPGNRTSQTMITDGNADGTFDDAADESTRTEYLVDEQNETGYSQVLEESADGALEKSYQLGHDVISQSDITNGNLILLYDGRGSTRRLVDAVGLPLSSEIYRFDAYGVPLGYRVAPGRCRPGAPTDPYVRALAHTVPLIMDSLRA